MKNFYRNVILRTYYKSLRVVKNIFGIQSYAHAKTDLKMKKYLLPLGKGIFFEAGANNGITTSRTFLLEEKYGWTGMLVEGIPARAEQCKKNRKNCIVENYALSSRDGETVKMKYIDLMSFVEGSFKTKEEEERHLSFGIKNNIPCYEVEVPTARISTLFDKHGITHIDFLSLDVEGYEVEALKGIDFTRHRPTYILIEARYRNDVDNFLWSVGYEAIEKLSFWDVLYKENEKSI